MLIRAALISAYAKDHSRRETMNLVGKMLGMDEFNEADHPRDEHGRFTNGNGYEDAAKASSDYKQFWKALPKEERAKFRTTEEIKQAFKEAKYGKPEVPLKEEVDPMKGFNSPDAYYFSREVGNMEPGDKMVGTHEVDGKTIQTTFEKTKGGNFVCTQSDPETGEVVSRKLVTNQEMANHVTENKGKWEQKKGSGGELEKLGKKLTEEKLAKIQKPVMKEPSSFYDPGDDPYDRDIEKAETYETLDKQFTKDQETDPLYASNIKHSPWSWYISGE